VKPFHNVKEIQLQKTMTVRVSDPGYWLDSDIAYTQVPGWFGHTTKNLKLSILRHFEGQPKPLPAIVWICGGGWLAMDRNAHLPNLVPLAQSGFVVASVEYRNSNEAKFPSQLEDIKSAIRFLRANAGRYQIDPDHIGVMGESAGGHLASLAGATNDIAEFDVGQSLDFSSRVQAVCAWYPPIDFSMLVQVPGTGDVPAGPSPEAQLLGQDPGANKALAAEASPLTYISETTPPFLLLHGLADSVVSPRHSELLYETLVSKGVEADLYLIEGADHAAVEFFQPQVREVITRFFDRHLKPRNL
jgi:acetyl esterase/lipase